MAKANRNKVAPAKVLTDEQPPNLLKYPTETIGTVIERLAQIEATLEVLANSFGPEDGNFDSHAFNVANMLAALTHETNALLIEGEVRHG